jgi:cytochrome P450
MGRTIIILNSFEAADAILNRKGGVSADRPQLPMTRLVGADKFVAALNGEKHRSARTFCHKALGTGAAVHPYLPLIEDEIRKSMLSIASDPGAFVDHIRRYCVVSLMEGKH